MIERILNPVLLFLLEALSLCWRLAEQAPRHLILVAVVTGALVLVAGGAALMRRRAARPARSISRRHRARLVRALAERGTSRLEIARTTGMCRDAVALLLRADEPADERPNFPRTARFAA